MNFVGYISTLAAPIIFYFLFFLFFFHIHYIQGKRIMPSHILKNARSCSITSNMNIALRARSIGINRPLTSKIWQNSVGVQVTMAKLFIASYCPSNMVCTLVAVSKWFSKKINIDLAIGGQGPDRSWLIGMRCKGNSHPSCTSSSHGLLLAFAGGDKGTDLLETCVCSSSIGWINSYVGVSSMDSTGIRCDPGPSGSSRPQVLAQSRPKSWVLLQ